MKIKEMIVSARVQPGDKLPPEAELASVLGLSRGSLREAVRALTFIGVLRTRQGDGTYVTALEPESLLETLDFVVDLARDKTVLEFFQIRRLLEPAATALAAARIDEGTLAELEASFRQMEEATSAEEFIDADQRFHYTIYQVTENEALSSLARSLGSRSFSARVWRARSEEGATEQAQRGHLAILTAIRERDPEVARSAAAMHLAEGEHWLRKALMLEEEAEVDLSELDGSDPGEQMT